MSTRPGKYAHVTSKLPKLPGVTTARPDIVDAVKREILEPVDELDPPNSAIQTHVDDADNAMENCFDAVKRAARGQRYASAFANGYAEMRRIMDKIDDWRSSGQVLLDAYEALMVEQFEVEGVASLRMDGGGSISTYQEPYPQVQDKEAYRQWCVAQGFERDMHLWPSKTASLVKEMLLSGDPEPPGVVAYSKTMVRLNKA